MAFMSVLVMAVIILLCIALFICFGLAGFLSLLMSLYLKKKEHKTESKLLLCVSVVQLISLAGAILLFVITDPLTTRIFTEDEEIKISWGDEEELVGTVKDDRPDLLAEMLEKEPAYINYIGEDGSSLLRSAIEERSYQTVCYLLEQGMEVEQMGESDQLGRDYTALECYLYSGNPKKDVDHQMVQVLLEKGALVNVKSRSIIQGMLEQMVWDGFLDVDDLELLQKMIDAGADLEQKNKKGEDMKAYYQRLMKKKRIVEKQPGAYQKGLEMLS